MSAAMIHIWTCVSTLDFVKDALFGAKSQVTYSHKYNKELGDWHSFQNTVGVHQITFATKKLLVHPTRLASLQKKSLYQYILVY